MQGVDSCLVSVATFDRLASRYADKYFHLDTYDRYLERFAEKVTLRGASILDVACGPGNVSRYLSKVRPDFTLVGIDLAEGMVREARERVPHAEFSVMDCRCMRNLGRTFDASVFAFGLSYLTDADVDRFFRSLNAITTESATLYLSTITGDPRLSGLDTSSGGDQVYLNYRGIGEVLSLVERAGYRIDFTEVVASPANAPMATQDLVVIAQRT